MTGIRACVLAVVATLVIVGVQPARADHDAEEAYFEVTDITTHTFVLKLTDPLQIAHARALLDGTTTERPHVFGRIVKRTASYNPRWSYHYDPTTIGFFDYAIEVCDATIPYVEDHLDEAGGPFLPGLLWCPWTSRLARELPAP
ncbi:calmodulin-binding protein [Thermomonospora umbrina]|nr:calmodulin-binding protein [Thermomonospora umbrina]